VSSLEREESIGAIRRATNNDVVTIWGLKHGIGPDHHTGEWLSSQESLNVFPNTMSSFQNVRECFSSESTHLDGGSTGTSINQS
jgi:hypothetical protein